MKEKVVPRVQVLTDKTQVGGKDRSAKGIPWKDLKDAAFDLIDKGIVDLDYKDGIPIVNVDKLDSIEIKLGVEALQELRAVL